MGDPLGRMADGLFLSLYHFGMTPAVDTTDFTIEVTYWRHGDWAWLDLSDTSVTVPAHGTASFDGTLTIPSDAAHGAYEGTIRVVDGSHVQTIPVTVAVAAEGADLEMGGTPPAGDLYDNGRVFGLTDAFWRPETGDWRIFWTDFAAGDLPASGQPYLFVDTAWEHARSDIDTIVLGPVEDCFSNGVGCGGQLTGFPGDPDRYGPYGLGRSGAAWTRTTAAGAGPSRPRPVGPQSAWSHPCARASTRCSSTTCRGRGRRRRAVRRWPWHRRAGSGVDRRTAGHVTGERDAVERHRARRPRG